eukprot:TRINITY_DN7541_c0_g1_i1.p3 TRINITY_DN7541_c0_g1~~TRINITY_DN7541_c0_g1_i1.p3  ORF type:complete len:50 (+),score=0.13 TRINITY_DN7541_c0_g1_i1:270-419(+)
MVAGEVTIQKKNSSTIVTNVRIIQNSSYQNFNGLGRLGPYNILCMTYRM